MEPRPKRGTRDARIPEEFEARWIGRTVRRRGELEAGKVTALRPSRRGVGVARLKEAWEGCVEYPSRLGGTYAVWLPLRLLEEVTP